MADQESSGFTVVDRRRAAQTEADDAAESSAETPSQVPDEDPAATTSAPSENAASAATTDEAELDESSFLPDPVTLLALAAMQLETRNLAKALLAVFDGHAWRHLGLVASPGTGETQKDLPSAQLAIDCVQFLLTKVESDLTDAERRESQRRLTDLRMNYLAKLREP